MKSKTTKEIKTILKSLNSKKASWIDRIPTKLGKLAFGIFAEPLSIAINNTIRTFTLLNSAQIAPLVPIDKITDDKHVISNFRAVSMLNCFSKLYEDVIKTEIVNLMNAHISPFIWAYQKNYNMQHVLLKRLLEEWRKHLENHKTVGEILMDLSKAFDCDPHNQLLAKLATYVTDDNLILCKHFCLLNRKCTVTDCNANT